MRNSALASSVAVCLCVGLSAPSFAAEPAAATPAAKAPPAQACLSDARAFGDKMRQGGYWLGGSDYGYGYPMGGYGYGYGYPMGAYPASAGYSNGRPGYEARVLISAATILAQRGQQVACEDVLTTARAVYQGYEAAMKTRGQFNDSPGWQMQQITSAKPVTTPGSTFRSDQLMDTEVLDPRDDSLGSVHDIVMSPQSGKIAYLVIGRGGLFGIDEKYVPVPWDAFKAPASVNMLVLDTTKATLDAAPRVNEDEFAAKGKFNQESQTVDAYWKTKLASDAN